METKEICQKLNQFLDEVNWGGKHYIDLSLFSQAADRLEAMDAQIYQHRAEIAELKQQLPEKQSEWISVEDVPYPDLDCNVNMSRHLYPQDVPCYLVFQGNGSGDDGVTHWMRVEPPKPKAPTFKDVFLKAFPKAIMYNDGIPLSCRASIFGGKCSLGSTKCFECWNQPYFETEEEGGEE